MSDRREYFKKWREKNKKKEQRKYRIRYTKKVLEKEGRLPTQILKELSYRVPSGIANFTNPHHVGILREILIEQGWKDDTIRSFISEILLPIRVGEKKYEEIIEKRKMDKLDEALSDVFGEEVEDVVNDEWDGASSLWVDGEESNFKWKYCPHCGKEINHE